MAGSSVGHARIDTNETFATKSSIAGGVTLTRPDLQASYVAALKAAQREPLQSQRDEKSEQLQQLLWNEPPPCDGCHYAYKAPTLPGAEAVSLGAASQGKAEGVSVAGTAQAVSAVSAVSSRAVLGSASTVLGYGSNSQWSDWNAAVQALQAEIAQLDTRIAAIDAKVYQDRSSLSTSPSGLHQPLLHTFDKTKATQELRDGVAVTAAFGKAAFQAAGTFAGKQAEAAQTACGGPGQPCPEADKWRDGGSYKALLHAVVGGVSNGSAGAVGALTAELATPYIRKELIAAGVAAETAAYDVLMSGAKSLIGAGVGGATGAASAFNADANNRQLHPDEVAYAKRKVSAWASRRGISLAQAEQELARGALYGNDLKWQVAYSSYSAEQVDAYAQAAEFLRVEAQRDGFHFQNLEGKLQAGFTSTPTQFENTRYLMQVAFADAGTRKFYSDNAALALGDLGAKGLVRFSAAGGLGVAKGLPQGVEEALRTYASLMDAATYQRFASAVMAVAANPKATFEQVLATAKSQGQEAVFGTYLSWMQKDSAALGESAGKVLGQFLVDSVAMASGVALYKNGAYIADGLTTVQAALARRISLEVDRIAENALLKSGGVFRPDGTPWLDLKTLSNDQKRIAGEFWGESMVRVAVPDGTKLGRTQSMGSTGIDDLYRVNRPGVDFVVIEYKFDNQGMAQTLDGRQMSDSWLLGSVTRTDRILEAVSGNSALADQVKDAMAQGRVEKWKINVKPDGSTEIRVLDGKGYVKPITQNGSKILCGRPDDKC
ncbi:hypothetical protein NYO99_07340 [Pelomonas sp. UHG3]|uniref:Uncharacterized protein n=1 Tax=Roseateles hydrophilus TaxID=2975054 RepID=A0ACC6C8Y2_9BURK|nr:hypothetical protein [Pelomonas sp. UHG3]MCY4744779.1 hypothetical protein [Pelomonas sp. UHG3]